MRSVILMSLANIKKKKVQSILISLTIMISAMLFSTAIGMISNAGKSMDSMYEKQKASQDILTFAKGVYDPAKIKSWWESKDVKVTEAMPMFYSTDKVVFKGKKLASSGLYITERLANSNGLDKLLFIEGKKKEYPGPGEIWIPTGFAYTNGIKAGDEISIPTMGGSRVMKVSAVVIDPQFSGALMDVIRIWVRPGVIEKADLFGKKTGFIIGLRFSDYAKETELWKNYLSYLKTPFLGGKLDKDTISVTYQIVQKISGAMLLIFSGIIILLIILIISFIISGSILSDYKNIGILKSQGFSSGNIITVYAGQYLILSLLSVLPGVFASYFVLKMILSSLVRSIGMAYMDYQMLLPALLTSLVLIGIVFATAWYTSKKAGKVNPSEAIRYGEPSRSHVSKSLSRQISLKALPVTMIMGIKQMLANVRQTMFLLLITSVTVFVFIFSVNLYNTMPNLGKNYAYWGYDNSQITITRADGVNGIAQSELMKALKKDVRVKDIIPWSILPRYPIDSASPNAKEGIGIAYDGDMNSIGVLNMKGRNPENENEITLTTKTAKAYGKKLGDFINVYIEGKKTSFLVTGIYQSMMRGGWSYRIQMSAVLKEYPSYTPNTYALNLRKTIDPTAFVRDMKKHFGNAIDIHISGEEMNSQFSGITGAIGALTVLLCTIFGSVSFIIIFNLTMMNIYRQKKSFGIYKAFGMTSGQIRLSIIYSILGISLLGAILGTILGFTASPGIMGSLMMNMGVGKFPFAFTIPGSIVSGIVSIFIIVLGAWIPSGKILKINTRNLIME